MTLARWRPDKAAGTMDAAPGEPWPFSRSGIIPCLEKEDSVKTLGRNPSRRELPEKEELRMTYSSFEYFDAEIDRFSKKHAGIDETELIDLLSGTAMEEELRDVEEEDLEGLDE